ncbi:MAG TPA: HigA family addiction module antitoxin [Chitinophagaceae bacterium]|jgi:HTH-type transcriptional regulator/antitoxin HigA
MSNYIVTDKNGKQLKTNVTLHPGEVLAEELEARSIRKKDFAELLEMHPPHLSDILKGKRHISARLAIKLEQQLGIDASFWLRLQIVYDLAVVRKETQKVH